MLLVSQLVLLILQLVLLVLTREFELVTRRFELATRGFELVARGFELVIRRFELVTREFELVTRNSCFTFPQMSVLFVTETYEDKDKPYKVHLFNLMGQQRFKCSQRSYSALYYYLT